MVQNWSVLLASKPRELVISGSEASKQIEDENGLNQLLFKLSSLNFLEVSKTALKELPAHIDKLMNLTNLVLRNNELAELPINIGKLEKLKLLDLANNQLTELPAEINDLVNLQSLNVTMNKIEEFPDSLKKLTNLLCVKLGFNKLTEFPEALCAEELKQHLGEIYAPSNQIGNIPSKIKRLGALKVLDLSENKVEYVPGELAECLKMKDLNLKGNKLKDRRLMKLVEQSKQKQILDYIRANCPKGNQMLATKGGGEREGSVERRSKVKDARRRRRSSSRSSQGEPEEEEPMDSVKILTVKNDDYRLVIATPAVLQIRKIVCCVVRNVDLSTAGTLKRFLGVQTSLHESVCLKRQAATIATHDLAKIEGKITFDVRAPGKLKLTPLGRSKEMSALELYRNLKDEAELYRKEKKRNTYSGIHKYLYLLKGVQRYPFLKDESERVLSFPPITNSDSTKMSEETKNIFIEVTGESQPICKNVMDNLLKEMLKLGIGGHGEPTPAESAMGPRDPNKKLLEVEPVKIFDPEGKLYVVYPSRIDLQFDDVKIIRGAD